MYVRLLTKRLFHVVLKEVGGRRKKNIKTGYRVCEVFKKLHLPLHNPSGTIENSLRTLKDKTAYCYSWVCVVKRSIDTGNETRFNRL